ncbi:MAG: YitT family protein [Pseudomonadota bacterium]
MRTLLGIEKIDLRTMTWNILLIASGSFISATGINAFLVPHKFLSGGVSGLSQLLSYVSPVSVGTCVLLLNIPVFIFGFRYVGRVFVLGSLVGLTAFTLSLWGTSWMAHTGWAPEKMLSALIGGALSGGGTGLVFRANSSHGGVDIIAAAVKKRWSISIGTVVFMSNALIVSILALIFGLHVALYTIVAQFVSSMTLDKVLMGLDTSRAVFIISSEPQKIADLITKKLGRGVTFLDGEGAYLGRRQRVIYCVVLLSQLARVKHYVQSTDPQAFLTIAEVNEVLGKGFKAVPI